MCEPTRVLSLKELSVVGIWSQKSDAGVFFVLCLVLIRQVFPASFVQSCSM